MFVFINLKDKKKIKTKIIKTFEKKIFLIKKISNFLFINFFSFDSFICSYWILPKFCAVTLSNNECNRPCPCFEMPLPKPNAKCRCACSKDVCDCDSADVRLSRGAILTSPYIVLEVSPNPSPRSPRSAEESFFWWRWFSIAASDVAFPSVALFSVALFSVTVSVAVSVAVSVVVSVVVLALPSSPFLPFYV